MVIIGSASQRVVDSARLDGDSDELEDLGLIMPYSKEEEEHEEEEMIGFPDFEVGYSPVLIKAKKQRNTLSPHIQAETNSANSSILLKEIISKSKVQDRIFQQPNYPF